MTPYPSASLCLATGLRHCLVSLRMLPITYFSRWRHKSMHSFNKLSADTVLCARSKNTRFVFQFWFQLFLCYLLPFVNYYQWKLKIPKQFSNITSLFSCMLWCIVSCIVSWHSYRDMYRFLRKCIVAALTGSHTTWLTVYNIFQQQDHYRVLGLGKLRHKATAADIKKACN